MGIIRIILAVSVLGSHAGFQLWTDGRSAVLLFYVISGYLITSVMNTSYKNEVINFYINRALRIFPPALVVAIIYGIVLIAFSDHPAFRSNILSVKLFSIVTNIIIFGQDLSWLFAENDGKILLLPYGSTGLGIGLSGYQANPPMFSIAIELYFYILAPFIVRSVNRTLIFSLLGCSYHIFLIVLGEKSVGWGYHLFVSSFFYFGSGSLSYHLFNADTALQKKVIYLFLIAMVLANELFNNIGMPLAFVLLLFGLPALADLTSEIKFDRILGNLSYLVYLTHWPVLIFIGSFLQGKQLFCALLILSILISIILRFVVEKPIDKLRDAIRGKGVY